MISATRKLFYQLSRNNRLFMKKFDDSKKLFKQYKSKHYYDTLLSFSNQLLLCLNDVNKGNLHLPKNFSLDKMFHSILSFRMCNHLFLCNRSQYESNMCTFCTKTYIKHKRYQTTSIEHCFCK